MIWTNVVHQSAKFETFDCSREISPNLYFDRLLLLKVHKIVAKKVQKSYISRHQTVMQNFKKNWFFVSKMTGISWILILALKSFKILHFDWSLSCKVYNVWPKNVGRSYLSWQWEMMQNLKRNWLSSSKLTWGIWWFVTLALENLRNQHCNKLVWTKVYNVWATKVQRSYAWSHWTLM